MNKTITANNAPAFGENGGSRNPDGCARAERKTRQHEGEIRDGKEIEKGGNHAVRYGAEK